MREDQPTPMAKPIWAYAYEIEPCQSEDRLRSIQALLDQAHADAHGRSRKWEGRFVCEKRVTHILVVSDSPDEDGEINRRLEAGMRELHTPYSRTAPLEVMEPE